MKPNFVKELIIKAKRMKQAHPELRCGQALMNTLHDLNYELYTDIVLAVKNNVDCFYNDVMIAHFLAYIEERLQQERENLSKMKVSYYLSRRHNDQNVV